MAEYIEREYLMEGRVENDPVRIAAKCAPAADVAPVRHGRWVDDGGDGVFMGIHRHHCSECGAQISILLPGMNYCAGCGAKMDGGENAWK